MKKILIVSVTLLMVVSGVFAEENNGPDKKLATDIRQGGVLY